MSFRQRQYLLILPFVLMVVCAGSVPLRASDEAVAALRATAAKLYSERAYKPAYEAWKKLAASGIAEADRPKVEFFLADSLWRSQPAADQVDEARRLLLTIAEAHPDASLGAEAWESIADSWLANDRDWPRAWDAYQRALSIWAASEDVNLARDRYLAIVWKATGPPGESNRVTLLPRDVLTNALAIAKTDENIARARFFLGLWLADQEDSFSIRRAGSEWSQVLAMGARTAVYESALFNLAKWSLVAGASTWKPDGSLVLMPNFQRAYGLFQRLLKEFPESRYASDATTEVGELTRAEISLTTDKSYLPGSEPLIIMESRNVSSVDLSMFRVDLKTAFQPTPATEPEDWQTAISLDKLKPVREWKYSVETPKPFVPGRTEIPMDPVTEPGAYILQASSGGLKSRTLFIVTSVAGMLRASSDEAVALVCDVSSGKAAPAVEARLWQAEREDGKWLWTSMDAGTAAAGLLRFELPKDHAGSSASLLLLAKADTAPVFLTSYASRALSPSGKWKFLVITDRHLAHPGSDVGWKLMARQTEGDSLRTPAGEVVQWKIIAPDGEEVSRGGISLNEFGSGWGTFKAEASAPLGEYMIEFYSSSEWIGESALVRIAAPSKPPFSVALGLSGQSGRTVRLGETLRVVVRAEYPLGGGVPDALVSVTLRESPYQREGTLRLSGTQDLPPGGLSRVVRQDEMRTAPDGRVVIEVPTPPDSPMDLLYDVDVVVRDASGREVSGSRQFIVARHGYFADMRVPMRIVEPGATAQVFVQTRDANDTPVSTKGTVVVQREDTAEIWIAPDGRDVTGEELDQLRLGQFPPAGEDGWILKSRGQVLVEVSRNEVETNDAGLAVFPFVSNEVGFFRILWESSDAGGPPVTSETAVWVSNAATEMVTYRGRGLQIIADPAGTSADGALDVLLVTDTPNRDVLLTVGAGQGLFHSDLIHLTGNARLVRLASDPRFAPNVFLQASTIRSGEFFSDTTEVRFPNWANRLDLTFVDLEQNPSPGNESALRLRVRDLTGEPVRAELALAVVSTSADPEWGSGLQNPLDIFHGGLRAQGGTLVSSLSESKTVFETRATRDLVRARAVDAPPGSTTDTSSYQSATAPALPGEEVGARPSPDKFPDFPGGRDAQPAVALWRPDLRSTGSGEVSANIVYPETLTNWRVAAWAASRDGSFGFVTASVDAMPPLLVRLVTPEFLVRGDEAFIRAVIRNGTDAQVRVRTELKASVVDVAEAVRDSRVKPSDQVDVVWPVVATASGVSRVALDVQGAEKTDVLEQSFPVLSRGREVSLSAAGLLKGTGVEVTMELAPDHDPGSANLEIAVAGSIGDALLDALPQLLAVDAINISELMARFVPLTLLHEALQNSGIRDEELARRFPAPDGSGDRFRAVTSSGLNTLYNQQTTDGGWAWVAGAVADPWVTAYVVWNLRLAQTSGVGIREDKIEAAADWLRPLLREEKVVPAMKAWILQALGYLQSGQRKPGKDESSALDELWNLRDKLSADALALFALAANQFGQNQRATSLIGLLEKLAITDVAADGQLMSAKWSASPEGPSMLNSTETTAFALMAMTAIAPKNPLIAAAEAGLMQMRTGLTWSDPRTSNIAIASLVPRSTFPTTAKPEIPEIEVNGESVPRPDSKATSSETASDVVDPGFLNSGRNMITIRRRSADAPFYYAIRLNYFTAAAVADSADAAFSIKRDYYKLDAFDTLLDGWRYEKTQWKDGDSVRLNSRIEEEITIQSNVTASYARVTDRLPAGLEPVDIHSGQLLAAENAAGEKIVVRADVREQEVVFQFPTIPPGGWKLRYQLRAKLAGSFFGPAAVLTADGGQTPPASSTSWQVRIDP